MDKKQRKQIRRQIRLQKKMAQQKSKGWQGTFTHTLVIAGYQDESERLVRLTGALTCMDAKNQRDEVIEKKEVWLDKALTLEKANKIASNQLMEWMETVVPKHNLDPEVLYVTQVEGMVPLEKCTECDCGEFIYISIGYSFFERV